MARGAVGSETFTWCGSARATPVSSTTRRAAPRSRWPSHSSRASTTISCSCSASIRTASVRRPPAISGRRPSGPGARRVPDLPITVARRDAPALLGHSGWPHRLVRRDGGGSGPCPCPSERARAQLRLPLRVDSRPVLCRAGGCQRRRENGLLDAAVGFVRDRLLDDGAMLKPAYTTTGGQIYDEHTIDLPRVSRRDERRRQLGQRAVPARRVRRSTAALRRRRRPRSPRRRRMARRRDCGRGDRASLARTGRRYLGDPTGRVDAQPTDLRRRPARHRRAIAKWTGAGVARPRRRDRGRRLRPRPPSRPDAGDARPTVTARRRAHLPALRGAIPHGDPRSVATFTGIRARVDRGKATHTASARMSGRSEKQRAHSSSAASSSRSPTRSRAMPSRLAGSSGTALHAAHRPARRGVPTSLNGSCAETCRKRSCTPSCSSARCNRTRWRPSARMHPRTLPSLRALYGAALVLAPGTIVEAVSRHRPDRLELALTRALGVRHLAQAAIAGGSDDVRRIRAGVAIDVAHSASMMLLAAARPRDRSLATASALTSAVMACGGWAEARARNV